MTLQSLVKSTQLKKDLILSSNIYFLFKKICLLYELIFITEKNLDMSLNPQSKNF